MEAVEGVGFYDMEGVRFYPTDEELIHLLEAKRLDLGFSVQMILQANIYQSEPPQLFDNWRRETGQDEKWCNYYSAPDYMKDSSQRLQQLTETGYCDDCVKRATKTGYWKVTGKPRFIKAKRSKEVIGFKRTLVFYIRSRSPGSKEIRTNWVMREFVIRYDPSFKKDFVLCRIKWKQDKKRHILTKNVDSQAKKRRISTKNADRQAKKPHISTKNVDRRAKKPRVSIYDKAQPSHNMAFDDGIHYWISNSRNPVGENNSQESRCDSISNPSHVAENISPELQPSYDSIPNSWQHAAEAPEYTSLVETLPPAESSVFNGCSGLHQTSVFALQSRKHPESQPQPSCDSISNSGQHAAETPEYTSGVDHLPPLNGCSGLDHTSFSAPPLSTQNSPLGIEWEFNVSPPLTVQVEYPGEETGRDTPLYLNSSKSARGFCGGDISDVDTATFISRVSDIFQY